MTTSKPASFLLLITTFLPLSPCSAQDQPLPPSEAPKHMTLPEGFRATLFAGEPDVRQPISFTFDDRGRLWVAECYSYPRWLTSGQGKDRILIFEDKNGTGHFDTCKVFWDKGTNISGIQLGFGGVWVCAIPNLLFIPDRNGDDVPDGPPEILLDGWDMNAKHNVFNSLTWGPDGWLYGCNGILATSHVGKPRTPATERVPMNCGVWRYHPIKHVFEVVAHGTTNPWGLDFDDRGQMFITNCVIHHLWHVIPGAHYQRMYGQDFNPHLYGLMESCADHIHWGGGNWTESRGGKGEHDQPGGGHAHVGAMVYLGDNWPDRYRNTIFMCNLHGNRVNQDLLERRGSGYVAHHGKDFLLANDPWFRGLAIQYGPDGGVYVSDWCDTGECHNYDRADQTNGRIYKITYGQAAPVNIDVSRLSDEELIKLQLHKNAWFSRHARRVLQERAQTRKLSSPDLASLTKMLSSDNPVVSVRLCALWTLHVCDGLDANQLLGLLDDKEETIRGWAVQLSLEERRLSTALLTKLATLAGKDPSPWVRLYLTSALQRMPLKQCWPIAEAPSSHAEDAADPNLPLMLWYGIEPLSQDSEPGFVLLIAKTRIQSIRERIAHLITVTGEIDESSAPGLHTLVRLLDQSDDATIQTDVLRGISEALIGRRKVRMPYGWTDVSQKLAGSASAVVREQALLLSLIFGDPLAVSALRRVVLDTSSSIPSRQTALQALVFHKNADLAPLLQQLLADRALRGAAIRGLAAFSDEATPGVILNRYASFTDEEKADAVQTLASRTMYAKALLDAVETGQVARRDLSAFTARQILALNDKQTAARLTKVWGTIRPASQEKAALMSRYKALLTPDYLKSADRSNGRQIFAKTCASCHVLFGEGGKIGPELTGSQRANLDYILENILDPSAVVPSEYQVTIIQTQDGRVLSGIIKQENEHSILVQTQNEQFRVPKVEIEQRTKSPISMMPDGLLASLKNEEVRDLIAYLASSVQVPLKLAPPASKQ